MATLFKDVLMLDGGRGLGMQCAVIEYARNVMGLTKAHSEEFDLTTPDPVIYLMKEWFDFRRQCIQRRNANSKKGRSLYRNQSIMWDLMRRY